MASSISPRLTVLTPAQGHDAATLAAIHAESFAAPWSDDDFSVFLRQAGVMGWIARDSRSSGFILVRRAVEEAEVLTLAVLPAARRRGIGRLLLGHAMDKLRASGTASLFLEVAVDNVSALGLYRGLGFDLCGKRRSYYDSESGKPRGDALVMRCDL